jgi:hypothetical protein
MAMSWQQINFVGPSRAIAGSGDDNRLISSFPHFHFLQPDNARLRLGDRAFPQVARKYMIVIIRKQRLLELAPHIVAICLWWMDFEALDKNSVSR